MPEGAGDRLGAASHADGRGSRPPSKGFISGWPLVCIFMCFYFLSFVDRAIISLMVEAIAHDLRLTDVQMGLLLGPAFGVFYAAAGIPIGWLLDRYSRRWICMSMVVLWGFATTVSGFAHSFWFLFFSRMGLGAGEAGLSPAAYTMIADQVPSRRLPTAYSFYTIGAFAGGGLAIVGGGWIIQALDSLETVSIPGLGKFYPWQVAFLLVGGFTMALAPLALLLRENIRPSPSAPRSNERTRGGSGLIALIHSDPLFYLGYPFAFGSINVMVTAFHAWTPAFMSRTYGWDIGEVSLAYGVTQGGAGVIGLIATGWLVEWLYNRGVTDAHVRVPALGLCASIPAMILGILSGSPGIFLAASVLFWGVTYTYAGYAPAALQLGTPLPFRGRIGALYITFLAVMGLFIGPPAVSWVTEGIFHDKSKIGLSLVVVMTVWTPISLLALVLAGRRLRLRHAAAKPGGAELAPV